MKGLVGADAAAYMENGMEMHVTCLPDGTVQLSKKLMTTSERLVMGVPLDINAMSEADFDRVPGIGPTTAERIAEYRQSNGGRMKVSDLLFIEGIGEKKYNHLLKYF
ncbi:MAG: helix-hairpin-helix domain-containing protein [Geobacteraceae bacterium]|nr:helix-hairpin-helix domain-containing protein [Geobacteraceae bacterium]